MQRAFFVVVEWQKSKFTTSEKVCRIMNKFRAYFELKYYGQQEMQTNAKNWNVNEGQKNPHGYCINHGSLTKQIWIEFKRF